MTSAYANQEHRIGCGCSRPSCEHLRALESALIAAERRLSVQSRGSEACEGCGSDRSFHRAGYEVPLCDSCCEELDRAAKVDDQEADVVECCR
jgi:hypothetical protein